MMALEQSQDGESYCVLINEEEQYSLWLVDNPVPAGWKRTGPAGDQETCLQHVRTVWTDMRPRSLREAMARKAP